MIKLENFLLENGYIKFAYDFKSKDYYEPKEHIISTMLNLEHSYFHKTDIHKKNRIIIGLHEAYKPVTLIYPRPNIRAKRIIENEIIIDNELSDDIMNVALSKFSNFEIFEAMYNKSITLEIDLTNETKQI